MSRKYKIKDQTRPHFVSFSVVHWIDLFTRPIYASLLIDSLRYCQKNKGLTIHAWCLMTNHIHLIIGTRKDPIQDILRDFKKFTSKSLKNEIINNHQESRKSWILWMMEKTGKRNKNNNSWQLWQQHNHPIELSSKKLIDQKLNYLHMNPVNAGFVSRPEYWLYCSAADYCGEKGFLSVELLSELGALFRGTSIYLRHLMRRFVDWGHKWILAHLLNVSQPINSKNFCTALPR